MHRLVIFLLFSAAIEAGTNIANKGAVQPRPPRNQQAAKLWRPPTSPRPGLNQYRIRPKPVNAKRMKNLLKPAPASKCKTDPNSTQMQALMQPSKTKLALTAYVDWNPLLTYRKSMANNLDVTINGPSTATYLICVNPATDEAKVPGRASVPFPVSGTYKFYKLTGKYSGVTFGTLRIRKEQYKTFVEQRCVFRFPGTWLPQPGPVEWRWRFEFGGTAEQAEIAPGSTYLTIKQQTAQMIADHWPPCCKDPPPSPTADSSVQWRRWHARKSSDQSYHGDNMGPIGGRRGTNAGWYVKVAMKTYWHIKETDVTKTEIDTSTCRPIKCVAADGSEYGPLWFDGCLACAFGNWTEYTIKEWYGIYIRTHQIHMTNYAKARAACLAKDSKYIFVQPFKNQPDYFYRFEIIGTPTTIRPIMPGFMYQTVTQEMAQIYVNNMTGPSRFG